MKGQRMAAMLPTVPSVQQCCNWDVQRCSLQRGARAFQPTHHPHQYLIEAREGLGTRTPIDPFRDSERRVRASTSALSNTIGN